jgi:hypothetical protein
MRFSLAPSDAAQCLRSRHAAAVLTCARRTCHPTAPHSVLVHSCTFSAYIATRAQSARPVSAAICLLLGVSSCGRSTTASSLKRASAFLPNSRQHADESNSLTRSDDNRCNRGRVVSIGHHHQQRSVILDKPRRERLTCRLGNHRFWLCETHRRNEQSTRDPLHLRAERGRPSVRLHGDIPVSHDMPSPSCCCCNTHLRVLQSVRRWRNGRRRIRILLRLSQWLNRRACCPIIGTQRLLQNFPESGSRGHLQRCHGGQ